MPGVTMSQIVPEGNGNEPFEMVAGNTFVITHTLLENLQNPKKIPKGEGLPKMVVLKRAGKHYGQEDGYTRVFLAEEKPNKGFVLFMSDYNLKIDTEHVVVWINDNSAAAVPLDQKEKYLIKCQEQKSTTQ